MKKLSRKSAEKHYKKLVEIHAFEYLTFSQKVGVFQQDLEHEILKEVTEEREYFDQFNILKNNQKRMVNGKEQGFIPQAYVSDIENLKKWRNRGVHEDEMPETKYRNHLHTMAQTINFFSDIPCTKEINDILNNQEKRNDNIQPIQVLSKKANTNGLSNLKIPFRPIDDENDIRNNIIKFNHIVKNEKSSKIIQLFSSFSYWYYFEDWNIFVPNKFLGYKNCADTAYELGCKMNGSIARKKLSKYFKIISDERRIEYLLSKFNSFSQELGQNVNVNVTFLEPDKQYFSVFKK